MKLQGLFDVPSLQHISFTRVAVLLWNRQRVIPQLSQHIALSQFYKQHLITSEWQVFETSVVGNVMKLPIPHFLKQELILFVRGAGWRILEWFTFHENLSPDDSTLTNMFSWSSRGIIDYTKTAEILVQDQNLAISKRYVLSCLYCLEESISSLSNTVRFEILDRRVTNMNIPDKKKLLAFFWSDYLQKRDIRRNDSLLVRHLNGADTFANNGFQLSTNISNVDAMKFFFEKMSAEEEEINLLQTAKMVATRSFMGGPPVFQADVMCFLLSAMNEDEQMELLQDKKFDVLKALLVWPWQNFFIEIVERLRSSFSDNDYYTLLDLIIDRVSHLCQDYNYVKLFADYWQEISINCRQYYIDKAITNNTLVKLFDIGSRQLIALVLKDISASQKEVIIFDSGSQNICLELILSDNWNMLEFTLVECIHSMDDDVTSKIVQLKQDLESQVQQRGWRRISRERDLLWSKFFNLLDELIHENDERITERSDVSVKRFRRT